MKTFGGNDGSAAATVRGARIGRDAAGHRDGRTPARELVFDFSGLHPPDIGDLSLVLTARLHSAEGDRVWARALPQATWMVLGALGLDHLFHRYPSADQRH